MDDNEKFSDKKKSCNCGEKKKGPNKSSKKKDKKFK
jgi:hypothetical protein